MFHEDMAVVAKRRNQLRKGGPIISVELSRPSGEIGPCPDPIDVAAIIDTGAYHVVLKTGIAERLGLPVIGTTLTASATHTDYPCTKYRVKLTFSGSFCLILDAVELPLPAHNYECLIGRGILKHAQFTYDGLTGTFSLTF